MFTPPSSYIITAANAPAIIMQCAYYKIYILCLFVFHFRPSQGDLKDLVLTGVCLHMSHLSHLKYLFSSSPFLYIFIDYNYTMPLLYFLIKDLFYYVYVFFSLMLWDLVR